MAGPLRGLPEQETAVAQPEHEDAPRHREGRQAARSPGHGHPSRHEELLTTLQIDLERGRMVISPPIHDGARYPVASFPIMFGALIFTELIFWVGLIFALDSLLLIFLVLLHSGKGGGLSDMFGGSIGATAAGSTVVERNLDRITVVAAIVFAFTTIGYGLLLS